MKPFRLAPGVFLPPNAATSTFALLGTRGSGKSYGAGVLVEQFLQQLVQVVVVDPVGLWWGLRLAADGKHKGFDIPVFGGIHGDVPLEHTGGALVAQLIVERGLSIVLDVSDFTDGQQHRFVTDLAREVFQLKKRNRSPLHIVFEEGHEFFPQFVDGAAAPMVGATKRLWKVGRNYGIGGTIISPRAAEVNKGALNLTDRIITGQLKAPEDIKRIDGWANATGASDDMVKELPRLPKGTLIVWDNEGGATRAVFDKKRTFDSSSTPDGSTARSTKLAPIDLDAVREAMAATIEEAKANDPKALKARIAELEKAASKQVPAPTKTVEKPVLKEADHERLEKLVVKLVAAQDSLGVIMKEGRETAAHLIDTLAQRQQAITSEIGNLRTLLGAVTPNTTLVYGSSGGNNFTATTPAVKTRVLHRPADGVEALPAVTQRMLGALRQGEAMGYTSMLFKNVAHIAGVSSTSGTTSNRKGTLTGGGYITSVGPFVSLTDKGRAYPIDVDLPPTDRAGLLAFWKREIGTDKVCRILDVVVSRGRVSNADLATSVEMAADSGTFSNYKGVLTGRGLITKSGRDYVPAEVFTR